MPISIFVLPLILSYLITRKIHISVTKREKWRVKIQFTLCGIPFSKILKQKDHRKEQKTDNQHSRSRRVSARIINGLRHAELEIKRLNLPVFDVSRGEKGIYLSEIKYHALISALLAFLNSKSKKLTVSDNAITLYSDSDSYFLDATITARLFHILSTCTLICIDEKRRKRELRCQKIR